MTKPVTPDLPNSGWSRVLSNGDHDASYNAAWLRAAKKTGRLFGVNVSTLDEFEREYLLGQMWAKRDQYTAIKELARWRAMSFHTETEERASEQ